MSKLPSLREIFPRDPDDVGTSEYRLVYDHLLDALDVGLETPLSQSDIELAYATLSELLIEVQECELCINRALSARRKEANHD